jgi:hypothetical protein
MGGEHTNLTFSGASSMQTKYFIRTQEPGAEPGWLRNSTVSNTLQEAERRAESFHEAGYTVEIDEVTTTMIRRWHDPDLSIEYETPDEEWN